MRSWLSQFPSKLATSLLDFLFAVYRFFFSPLFHLLAGPGMGCRFEPTCSEYCQEAIRRYGPWRGGGLALRRILRCQPWGGRSGYDPLP